MSCNITLKKGLVGVKPVDFCAWLFDVLGAQVGDELIDLFPGSGRRVRLRHQRDVQRTHREVPRGAPMSCARCGRDHTTAISPSIVPPQPVKTDMQRIADALERIAKALELGNRMPITGHRRIWGCCLAHDEQARSEVR